MTTATASPEQRLERTFASPTGLRALTVISHKNVGRRFMVTAFVFFLIGGVEALLLRAQLAGPEADLLGPEAYNRIFTLHGTTMMFLFVVPFLEGLANYLTPLVIGARDLPFPRFNAFNYWLFVLGGGTIYASILAGDVPDGGWFAYPPLTGPVYSPGDGLDFWLVGVTLAEISAIGAAIEFIAAILKTRAPGMSLDRLPIFSWAILGTAGMIVVAFTPLLLGSVLLTADRGFGTHFYDPDAGGSALLWQHFFWIFGHPEVYVMFLPAAGIVAQVIQASVRRGIVAYPLVVGAILAVALLSMGLWVHHMFTVGIPNAPLLFFTAASLLIAIPNGIQIFAYVATIWRGRPRFTTSLLFVISFVIVFVLGGITGVMVAVAPFDWQAHDSYFLVAHFHYVLIGGVLFPIFAAIYHWFPKLFGTRVSERAGRWSVALMFVGFNVTFFPMHLTGLLGMPRRVFTYAEEEGWGALNLVSSLGAVVLTAGILVTVVAALVAWRRGAEAGPDPWGADTLEWTTSSPPPPENFARLPVVSSRHPGWEQEPGEPEDEALVDELSRRPLAWRATLATSALDARPTEVVHLSRPTAIPIVPALGLLLMAFGSVSGTPPALVLGALVVIGGLALWAWRNESERAADLRDFAPVRGVRADVPGPAGMGWWAIALGLLVALVLLGSVVFAYLYLRFHAPEWPLAGAERPGLVLPAMAAGLSLVSAVPIRLAARRPRSPAVSGLLALTIALGAAVLVLLIADWRDLPVPATLDAYGSATAAVAWFAIAVLVLALGVLGVLLGVLRGGSVSDRQALWIRHAADIWAFAALTGMIAPLTTSLGAYG